MFESMPKKEDNESHPFDPDAEGRVPEQWLKAFEKFHESTHQLQIAYRTLEKRVRELNIELEEANRELQKNLAEKEGLEGYLRQILEGLGVGVIVTDLNGGITLVNRTAKSWLALDEDCIGKGMDEVLSKTLAQSEIDVLKAAVGSDDTVSVERSLKKKDNEETLHLTLHGRRLTELSGEAMGLLVTVEDYTELRNMEREVALTQRLAAMGEMAVGIAHEVRNPLGGIHLFATLMAKEPSEKQREGFADQIHSAIGAVEHILANLLTFAKPLKVTKSMLEADRVLDECLSFMGPLARQHGVEIESKKEEGLRTVAADRCLLKQALLNLLLNAVQAMPEGGVLKTWVREISSQGVGSQGSGPASLQRWIEIGIEDSGEGIKEDVLPSVFDPFFTTRPEGTGLGLAIVHNIVHAHGGGIRVRSEEQKGTTIRLRIPLPEGSGGLTEAERTDISHE